MRGEEGLEEMEVVEEDSGASAPVILVYAPGTDREVTSFIGKAPCPAAQILGLGVSLET